MSTDTLAIVLAVAGIIVGGAISWVFTRAAERDASSKQQKLISTLHSMFEDVADRFAEPTTPGSGKALRPPDLPARGANVLEASPQPATSSSALDVIVRASLGSLLDEHGEVSVPRLLRALAQRLPDASPPLISSSLQELRNAGRLTWSGDDVMKADVIKIYPQGHEPDMPGRTGEPLDAEESGE
jgi:hypothetical protein